MVAGLLLTGGGSARMGSVKAMLAVDGQPLAVRLAGVLSAALDGPVLEVGPGYSGLPSVTESPPGSGPLAAFAAGAAALADRGHAGATVLVACDLPFLSVDVVRWLAAQPGTAAPVVRGRRQPLCARYEPGAGALAAELVASGARAMGPLLDRLAVTWLDAASWGPVADETAFADVDTPADLALWGLRA